MRAADLLAAVPSRKAEAREGDYINDKGFLVCGKCGEEREMVIKVLDIEKIVSRQCLCERKEQEEQDRKEEEAKRKRIAERLKRECFSSQSYWELTFDKDDQENEKVSNVSRRFCEHFQELKENGQGLLFYGPVGTGKTTFGAMIANELMTQGYKCLFSSLSELGNKMQRTYSGKQEILEDLMRYDLVVLDDLGIERTTDTMNEYVYQIINTLYKEKISMICTTNLEIQSIINPDNNSQRRIYDRLLERCTAVKVDGSNRRKKAASENMKRAKELLGL